MLMPQQDTKTWPLSAEIEAFLAEPHIATLTTFRPDGTPHVVPVSFSWDSEARLARIMVGADSRKARNLVAAPGPRRGPGWRPRRGPGWRPGCRWRPRRGPGWGPWGRPRRGRPASGDG